MDINLFSSMSALAPTLLLYVGAIISFTLFRFAPDSNRVHLLRMWTITILLLSAYLELQMQFSGNVMSALVHDPFSRFFRLATAGGFSLLAIFLPAKSHGALSSKWQSSNLELTYSTILLSAGGIYFLASAYDLITLFIGFELCALPLYLYFKGITSIATNEAAAAPASDSKGQAQNQAENLRARFLRIFGYGIFSSLIMLLGFAVIYGIGGETNLIQLRVNISIVFLTYKKIGPALILAIALMSAGITAKMGMAPFHLWLGEFHGSKTSGALPLALLTGILSGVIALSRIFDNALIAFSGDVMTPLDWAPALTAIFTISTLLAVIAIIRERSLRRIFLWIALAQSAFAIIGIISASAAGLSGALLQTLFAVLTLAMLLPLVDRISPDEAENQNSGSIIEEPQLYHLTGLARKSPATAALITLALASIAGVPFTGGYIARAALLDSALLSQQWWAFSLIVVGSLAIIFVSVKIVASMYRKAEPTLATVSVPLSLSMRLAAAITCAVIIYAGISQEVATELTLQAVQVFGL